MISGYTCVVKTSPKNIKLRAQTTPKAEENPNRITIFLRLIRMPRKAADRYTPNNSVTA